MLSHIVRVCLVTFLLSLAAGLASAQTVGTAIRVTPGATLERGGAASSLRAGQPLASGDVISTDRRGQVQLLFADNTRIAVGPNSTFSIDDIRLKQNGRAQKFAVSAVAGGFRFLSGTSARSAYKIDTPTATMGIRGTAFDFVVRKAKGTDLVIFKGLVNMCGRSGCVPVTGGCEVVSQDVRGDFARIETRKEKRDLLQDGFLFVTNQQRLAPAFRTAIRSCGRDTIAPPRPKAGERETPRPTPRPTPPPAEPPPPPPPPPPPGGI